MTIFENIKALQIMISNNKMLVGYIKHKAILLFCILGLIA